jgi:UDP-N-acetylglucosamine transferase subunit ALG13
MNIFVTVGFESFSFNRLLRTIDEGVIEKLISPPVLIQTGHSSYQPLCCPAKRFLPFDEILDNLKKAEIVVSHAGVGTTLLTLSLGKIPILFPRQAKYREHVDDHQMEYARKMEQQKKVLMATDGPDLLGKIKNFHAIVARLRFDSPREKLPGLRSYLEEYLCGHLKRKGTGK